MNLLPIISIFMSVVDFIPLRDLIPIFYLPRCCPPLNISNSLLADSSNNNIMLTPTVFSNSAPPQLPITLPLFPPFLTWVVNHIPLRCLKLFFHPRPDLSAFPRSHPLPPDFPTLCFSLPDSLAPLSHPQLFRALHSESSRVLNLPGTSRVLTLSYYNNNYIITITSHFPPITNTLRCPFRHLFRLYVTEIIAHRNCLMKVVVDFFNPHRLYSPPLKSPTLCFYLPELSSPFPHSESSRALFHSESFRALLSELSRALIIPETSRILAHYKPPPNTPYFFSIAYTFQCPSPSSCQQYVNETIAHKSARLWTCLMKEIIIIIIFLT